MSFKGMRKSIHPMGAQPKAGQAPAHRLDKFPAGYSLAGCSPAEPASASPVRLILLRLIAFANEVLVNGNLSLVFLSHLRGAAHYETPELPGPDFR